MRFSCALPLVVRFFFLLAVHAIPSHSNAAELKLLFMGDNGHHRPVDMFHETARVLEKRGIEMKYTDRMEDLTPETLAGFDGLVLYANIDRIEDAQAQAVLASSVPLRWTSLFAMIGGSRQQPHELAAGHRMS